MCDAAAHLLCVNPHICACPYVAAELLLHLEILWTHALYSMLCGSQEAAAAVCRLWLEPAQLAEVQVASFGLSIIVCVRHKPPPPPPDVHTV